jgi:hypothetical protein
VADPDPREPVLSQLQGFTWSTGESAAYEAALDAINIAVGAYTALIAAEEAKQAPDQAAIAAARTGRADCARWREQLDPADHAAVADTRHRFTQLARDLRHRSE